MEKGHARVVEAVFRLIAFLQTLDPLKYAPPNPNLTIASFQALYAEAGALLADVSAAKENWRTRAKDRALDVDELPAKAASAVALFASLGVDKERVEQARTYLRKLQGRRASPAALDDPNTPADESEKSISASQTSAAQMIANFRALVDFLTAQPEYRALTEPGLQSADLTNLIDTIEAKHELAVTADAQVSSKRMERDKFFYDNPDSICDRGLLVKEYVKGKYGAASPEYLEVRSIEFKRD